MNSSFFSYLSTENVAHKLKWSQWILEKINLFSSRQLTQFKEFNILKSSSFYLSVQSSLHLWKSISKSKQIQNQWKIEME